MFKKSARCLAVILTAVICSGQPVYAMEEFADGERTEDFVSEITDMQLDSSGVMETEQIPDKQKEYTDSCSYEDSEIVSEPADGTVFKPIKPEEFAEEAVDLEEMPGRKICIRNNGKKSIEVKAGKLKNFTVWQEGSSDIIEPGGVVYFYIRAKYYDGIYKETFQISINSERTLKYIISQDCISTKNLLEISAQKLDFGKDAVFYKEAPKKQRIKVTNITQDVLTLKQHHATDAYKISSFGKTVLNPGESTSYCVRPRTGLGIGEYEVYDLGFQVSDTKGHQLKTYLAAEFEVTPNCVKAVMEPFMNKITGVPSGTKKTVADLWLPEYTTVLTYGEPGFDAGDDKEKIALKIDWDLKHCNYDPKKKEAQEFTVTGLVKLPSDVKNYNNVDLHVTANVQVKAYEYLGKPIIEKYVFGKNVNDIHVLLKEKCDGADGYEFVFVTDKKDLKKGKYAVFSDKAEKLTGIRDREIAGLMGEVEKGTYYAYARGFDLIKGKRIYSPWSDPIKIQVQYEKLYTPIIKSVKISGSTVKIVMENCKNAGGFDAVLAEKHNGGKPMDYVKILRNKSTSTLIFKNVKKGSYYLGVHSYRRDYYGKKRFSDWSKLKKIIVR